MCALEIAARGAVVRVPVISISISISVWLPHPLSSPLLLPLSVDTDADTEGVKPQRGKEVKRNGKEGRVRVRGALFTFDCGRLFEFACGVFFAGVNFRSCSCCSVSYIVGLCWPFNVLHSHSSCLFVRLLLPLRGVSLLLLHIHLELP